MPRPVHAVTARIVLGISRASAPAMLYGSLEYTVGYGHLDG